MAESDAKPNQLEEKAPAAGDGESQGLESLEKMVVDELNTDKTKEAIDKTKEAIESFAQGFAQSARGFASKVETWSSALHKQSPNATETLPTSDKHAGESSSADANTDNANNTTDEKQPLVGTTSWLNCCGILEVLARPSDK